MTPSCGGSGGGIITPPPPAPVASISPTGLSFGSVTINTPSTAQTVKLTNTGDAILSITGIAVTGTNASDFAQSNTCGNSVAAGANCAISVIFTPKATGSRSASLTITDNAANSPQTVSLSGTGTNTPTPTATLSTGSLVFSGQNIGSTSTVQAVTLSNTGNATLNITGIAVTGTNAGDFAQTNTCGSSVVAGTNCAINVIFTPSASGNRSALISVTDNASGSPQTVSLSGTGTAPAPLSIALDPSNLFDSGEMISDYGDIIPFTLSLNGFHTGDQIHTQTYGPLQEHVVTADEALTGKDTNPLNFLGPGPANVPLLGTASGTRISDGTVSNTVEFLYTVSQPMAVQDPANANEMYYYDAGTGMARSTTIRKYKDCTPDGTVTPGDAPNGITVDPQTGTLFTSGLGGVSVIDPSNQNHRATIVMGNTAVQSLAIHANGGLVCATQPEAGTTNCFLASQAFQANPPLISVPLPAGSQPVAVNVLDFSTSTLTGHVAVFGRGDATLRWFSLAAGVATPTATSPLTGTLLLPYTKTDAAYWNVHNWRRGWQIVSVGSTLALMGQVVNTSNGTVSQWLSVVGPSQTLIGSYELPGRTLQITPDPVNGAVVTEHPNFSVSPAVMELSRFYLDSGNRYNLGSTGLVPGAGFFVTITTPTNPTPKVATFAQGQIACQENQ